eukprot:1160473-Pelagomonas_calceolata.AAC.1
MVMWWLSDVGEGAWAQEKRVLEGANKGSEGGQAAHLLLQVPSITSNDASVSRRDRCMRALS